MIGVRIIPIFRSQLILKDSESRNGVSISTTSHRNNNARNLGIAQGSGIVVNPSINPQNHLRKDVLYGIHNWDRRTE
jgi:hypothetical protein